MTIAVFTTPPASLEKLARVFAADAADLHEDSLAAVLELVVGRAEIDHEVAEGLPQADHGAGRDRVEHELGRGAGLHAGGAGDDFGAGEGEDQDVDGVECLLGRRGAGDEGRRGAHDAGMLERTSHVRRGPGGGDSDDEIAGADAARVKIFDGAFDPVLGAFLRAGERGQPAGDDSLHHFGVGAVGRRTLGGVEHTESAGRAGADVEEATAAAKGRFGGLDGAGDGFALGADDRGNGPIFGVYKVDDFERRGEIDRGRAGVPALGEPRVDERHVAVNLCGVVRDPQQ